MEIRTADRRQNNVSIDADRRSGVDRRENPSLFYALEAVPTFRRTLSIPDKIEHGEAATAIGMASLALINLPEDLRDIKSAYNQLNGVKASYDYKNYQHDFSFLRGTAIEKWLHRKMDGGSMWAKWLYDNDKNLAQTAFAKKINNFTGAEESDIIETSIRDCKGETAIAIKYKGSFFAKLTARALRRTTKLGLLAMALLELPKIFKSKEKINQTGKSAVNVASLTAGIAYGGALGGRFGAMGSLLGMGAGAIAGAKISNKVQQAI